MDLTEVFADVPFNAHNGIELASAGDGTATARVELEEHHSANPVEIQAHGGLTYALADTAAGAAVMSVNVDSTLNVNMRIDYLHRARSETLEARAEVAYNGQHVSVVEVEITDETGTRIATARGTFKASSDGPALEDARTD
jgi:uncharacterized protein (TIGR00369 family)